MEIPNFDRRENIAKALVAAAAGVIAYKAYKEGKLGIARLYPGGSLFADIIKDAKDKTSRFAFLVKDTQPVEYEFDEIETSQELLEEVVEVFGINEEQDNSLQTP